jgi:hypothetical protein
MKRKSKEFGSLVRENVPEKPGHRSLARLLTVSMLGIALSAGASLCSQSLGWSQQSSLTVSQLSNPVTKTVRSEIGSSAVTNGRAREANPPMILTDDDDTGACYCQAVGQVWCTYTTAQWCNVYGNAPATSCTFAGGSSCPDN